MAKKKAREVLLRQVSHEEAYNLVVATLTKAARERESARGAVHRLDVEQLCDLLNAMEAHVELKLRDGVVCCYAPK